MKRLIPRLILPSTRAYIDEARRTPGFTLFDWLHGYVYGSWAYFYISMGIGEHPLARFAWPAVSWLAHFLWRWPETERNPGRRDDRISFADSYHGKVVPLEAATQLVTINEDVRLTDLEQIVPYARARDIILHNPDHIVVVECPCRSARQHPCLPLDVCLIIGEPFAGFVLEHHPKRSRQITPDEAVKIMQEEDERGHAHHAFFKDAMLGRFYAICNCCSCCCGAMQAHQYGTPMLASSGYVSHVDEHACIGCGECSKFCPFQALYVRDGVARVDAAACMGCGVCVNKCTQGALELVRDPAKGEPLEIRELMRSLPTTTSSSPRA